MLVSPLEKKIGALMTNPDAEKRQRNLEKQRRKIERERAAGFIRRTVTIPIERDPEHKKIVAEWRAQKQHDTGEKP